VKPSTQLSDGSVIGALLGTQANREVSIVNSFELTYSCRDGNGDVDMTADSVRDGHGRYTLDREFFETRREQCK
jgi:COP9 signalosome complex subunit 6